MAERVWKPADQGSYFDPANWVGGTVPVTGDTAVVDGSIGPAAARLGGALGPEIDASGNPSPRYDVVGLYSPGLTQISRNPDPATIPVAPTIANETIRSFGGTSDVEFQLVNTTLAATSDVEISGNANFQTFYNDTLAGTIRILPTAGVPNNAAGLNGELDIEPNVLGSVDPVARTVRSYVPTTTNTGTILVGANSRLGIYLTGNALTFFSNYNNQGYPVAAGGYETFVNSGAIGVADGSLYVSDPAYTGFPAFNQFINNGLIQIQSVNANASAVFDGAVYGTGAINGAGMADHRVALRFLGGVSNTITVTNGFADFEPYQQSTTTSYTGSFTFGDDNSTLIIGDPLVIPTGAFLPINGLRTGDAIAINSFAFGTPMLSRQPATATLNWSQAAGTLTVGYVNATSSGTVRTLRISGTHQQSDFSVYTTPGQSVVGAASYVSPMAIITVVACYCRGTRILTDRGEVAVEEVAAGDLAMTGSGALRPVRWVGRRAYTGRFALGNRDVWPVLITAGALGGGLPRRDLRVSPKHAMFLDGTLIPAELLVNGISILRSVPGDGVEYIHVELDDHQVIVAEGCLSESYIDDGNRGMFHNAASYGGAAADPGAERSYCAPRVESGPGLEAVRRRLAARVAMTAGDR